MNFLKIALKTGLTLEECTFLHYLYIAKNSNDENDIEELERYMNKDGYEEIITNTLINLSFHKYIKYITHKHSFKLGDIHLIEDSLKDFIIDKEQAWKEILAVYPTYGYIKGNKISLKNVSGFKVKDYYYKHIIKNGDLESHNDVIKIINHTFKNKLEKSSKIKTIKEFEQCIGLEKFIYSWDGFIQTFLQENG